jgi:hypothetical protein
MIMHNAHPLLKIHKNVPLSFPAAAVWVRHQWSYRGDHGMKWHNFQRHHTLFPARDLSPGPETEAGVSIIIRLQVACLKNCGWIPGTYRGLFPDEAKTSLFLKIPTIALGPSQHWIQRVPGSCFTVLNNWGGGGWKWQRTPTPCMD